MTFHIRHVTRATRLLQPHTPTSNQQHTHQNTTTLKPQAEAAFKETGQKEERVLVLEAWRELLASSVSRE